MIWLFRFNVDKLRNSPMNLLVTALTRMECLVVRIRLHISDDWMGEWRDVCIHSFCPSAFLAKGELGINVLKKVF